MIIRNLVVDMINIKHADRRVRVSLVEHGHLYENPATQPLLPCFSLNKVRVSPRLVSKQLPEPTYLAHAFVPFFQ